MLEDYFGFQIGELAEDVTTDKENHELGEHEGKTDYIVKLIKTFNNEFNDEVIAIYTK
jgi:hypothetical protein